MSQLRRPDDVDTLVFDLDGTICFDGSTIDDGIVDALGECHASGLTTMFASARPVRDMLPLLAPSLATSPLIGGNGGLVRMDGVTTSRSHFDDATRASLMELFDRHSATYLADGTWDYSYTGPARHPILDRVDQGSAAQRVEHHTLDRIVKLLVVGCADWDSLLAELATQEISFHHHADEMIINIMPGSTDKYEAVQSLDCGGYIAFGNDVNDIQLLANAALAVRVGEHPALDDVHHVSVEPDPAAVATAIRALAADSNSQ